MEFEPSEQGRLAPVTLKLIEDTEQTTGRQVALQRDRRSKVEARASYRASLSDKRRDIITVAPGESEYLDHLIAHELGHIRHFATVPAEKRRVPVIIPRVLQSFAAFLQGDSVVRAVASLGAPAYRAMVQRWAGGLSAQLANTPADIDIERSLARIPEMRPLQERSLREQIRRERQILHPEVRRNTPKAVWRASAAMVYALHAASAEALADETLMEPWRGFPNVARLGAELRALYDSTNPRDLDDFYAVSASWNEQLGLPTLLDLRPLDEVRGSEQR